MSKSQHKKQTNKNIKDSVHMRTLINIALVSVLFVLVLVAVYEPGLEMPPEPSKLTQLVPEDVTRISIQQARGATITLTRKDDSNEWSMIEPVALPANYFRIQELLPLLQSSSNAQYPVEGLDLKKYHLDKPSLQVTFNDLSIAFGDQDPINQLRYVVIGNTVHLTNDNYYHQLNAGVARFADTQILLPEYRPTRIELPEFVLTKDKQGWISTLKGSISADRINKLVDEWRHARGIKVSDYTSYRSKNKQLIKVSIEQQAKPIEFELTPLKDDIILGRKDIKLQYHLTRETLERLLKLPSEVTEY